jgi:peptidoglycan/xylan/chitin deacetylase (PgdA/CDA1 family)
MDRRVQVLVVLFLISFSAGQALAQHQVAYWSGNHTAAVSLTFDDSLPSQLSLVIPALNSYGMKGTFYVVTDSVDSDNSWSSWAAAAAMGHEIGSHTLDHPDLTTLSSSQLQAELQQSKAIIEAQIPTQKCLTIAYPFGSENATVEAASQKVYMASRGIQWEINYPPYQFNNLSARGDDPGSTLSGMKDSLDKAVSWGEWMVSFMHSMNGDGYGGWDMSMLTAYLDYIKTKDVWVATLADVIRYIRERSAASISIVSSSSSQIVLNLTHNLDNTIYNVPLTLRSEVPSAWTSVNVVQGSTSATIASVVESGTRVVYYSATPNGGQITLSSPSLQITSLSPSSTLAGSAGFTLQVTGSNFVSGSVVRWNGAARTTTFVSSTQLQAAITAADVASPGTASITVFNPTDNSVSGPVSFSIIQMSISAVAVSPASVIGGSSSQGTVTLSTAAPSGGVTVALSSNSSAATVPLSAFVAAGSSSAAFAITTSPVAASTSAGISAIYAGSSKTANLTITAAALSSLSLSPSTVVGGNSVQGTVTLNGPAPSGGALVTLSDNASAVTVPSTATVAEGSTTATFTITTTAVSASTSATVTAVYNGTTKTTTLTVSASTSLSSVSLSPTTVAGGNSSVGTVKLSAAAPASGTVVALSSSNSAAASVPSSVTVAAGSTTATFTVSTSPVASSTSVTVTATFNTTSKTAKLTVSAPALSSLSLNPTTVKGGNSSQGTITLTGPAPANGIKVSLSSNNSAATVPASVTVPAASSTATFVVSTKTVTASTSVRITATYSATSKSATLTVNASGMGVLPTSAWKLLYVDSQETVGENGAATNAFDGNTSTIWHTQWYSSSPALPHEIQIDMGAVYTVGGFQYLPRQDGEVNGRIGKYEFYLSQDGVTWSSAVATGTFANSAAQKEVQFTSSSARYVRFRALTEVNGNPWTSCAELRVLAIQ